MLTCKTCHTENLDDDGFCIECGLVKSEISTNHCSNPECKFHNVILPNPKQKYCGKCGSLTTYYEKIFGDI